MVINYPEAPTGVDEKIIAPSAAFKAQMLKVVLSILFFLVFYLMLFAAAVALACLCAYLGIVFIGFQVSFITAIISLGLIGLGIMVVFFLLKFMFKSHKVDRSAFIEITADDQPELFKFIKKVSLETKASFPKRIYISDEVNAGVFYDSSFLSMFFPVKKNLRIGLGLVNSVNISEFKAIIAHEFGHFSQRSMKFGSYVYYVNNIIYNMLYDNDDYDKVLNQWARIHSFFKGFANLTILIIRGIQYLLKQVYGLVNAAYSKLSIEMEYHADSVAAFVTGSDHLVTSFKKTEIGNMCFNTVLNYCNRNIANNLQSDNFYTQQTVVMRYFADRFNIPLRGDDLMIGDNNLDFLNRYRVTLKERWASHPSNDERAERLNQLNINTPAITDPAWVLFKDAVQLQKELTLKAYNAVNFEQTPQLFDIDAFTKAYLTEVKNNNFDKAYKGYYDGRDIERFVLDDVLSESHTIPATFDEMFNDANCALPAKISNLKTDIESLKLIADKENNIPVFNFDGVSTDSNDAPIVQQQLENELATAEAQLKQLDKVVFSFFYNRAEDENKQRLKGDYAIMFNGCDECAADMKLYTDTMAAMSPAYSQQNFVKIKLTMQDVNAAENHIIPRIQHVVDNAAEYELTDQQLTQLTDYLKHERVYYTQPHFDNDAIGMFNNAMNAFAGAVIDKSFKAKKNLYSFQLNL